MNIPDIDIDNPIFQDNELQVFIDQEQNNVFFAAADALDVLSTNQVYLMKVRSFGDGSSEDGASVSRELRARAATLRIQGQQSSGTTTASTGVAIVRNHRMLRGY